MTALHCACSHGAIKVCELLLQRDANLRSVDEEDMTPLHFAAMEGHTGSWIFSIILFFIFFQEHLLTMHFRS